MFKGVLWIQAALLIAVLSMRGAAEGEEMHRRGEDHSDELLLVHKLQTALTEGDSASRIATRRRIHDEHIRAHLAADPDVSVEVSEDVKRKYLDSRRRLLASSRSPTSPFRTACLVGIFTIPVIAFAVWMKL